MSRKLSEQIFQNMVGVGTDLDALLEHAQKTLPADRYRVLDGSGQKLARNFERIAVQLGMFLDQYERFSLPPKGPRGPATIHRLAPKKKRRR